MGYAVLGRIFFILRATLLVLLPCSAVAQFYAGGMVAVTSLSGDARSIITPGATQFSSYNPQNGPGLNLLAGKHFNDYFSIQGDYVWNRNALTLSAADVAGSSVSKYKETMQSSQHSAFASVLVYFRSRNSRLRPYLSVGTGFVHLSSSVQNVSVQQGSVIAPGAFDTNFIALRVPVGIDVKMHAGWYFRYSFTENISHNPISTQLSPPATHTFKNFQNLFGVIHQF